MHSPPVGEDTAREDRPDNLPGLTGLRFVAAFVVLLEHCKALFPEVLLHQHHWFTTHVGFLGMTLFFVLSGFVITHNYLGAFQRGVRSEAMYSFLTARIARLLPLFLVMLAAGLMASGFRENWQTRMFLVPLHLTPVESMLVWLRNGVPVLLDYFNVAWSIATEWAFYLSFPALALLILRLRSPRAVIACAALCIVAAWSAHWRVYSSRGEALSIYVHSMGSPPDAMQSDSVACYLSYASPLLRIFDFFLGCLAARLFHLLRGVAVTACESRWAHIGFAAACLGTACVEAALGDYHPMALLDLKSWTALPDMSFPVFLRINFLHAPFIACLLLYVTRYASPLRSLLDRRLLVLAGDTSYSIYLLHLWVIAWLARWVDRDAEASLATTAGALLRVALASVVVIAASRLLYVLVEVRGKRLIRGVAKRLARGAHARAFALLLCALLYAIVPATGLLLGRHWFFHPPGAP